MGSLLKRKAAYRDTFVPCILVMLSPTPSVHSPPPPASLPFLNFMSFKKKKNPLNSVGAAHMHVCMGSCMGAWVTLPMLPLQREVTCPQNPSTATGSSVRDWAWSLPYPIFEILKFLIFCGSVQWARLL